MEKLNRKMRVVIIGCGARGKDVYAKLQNTFPDEMEIVGVADPDKEKLAFMHENYNVPLERCYTDADELFKEKCFADIAFICTLDRLHYKYSIMAMKAGYHLLLEKPVAPTIEECMDIERVATENNRIVIVCHVLRYTPFFTKIKELVENGVVGNIMAMSAIEPVSYWHQAHSFVRGNWRNSDQTSPMILQKCCHDLDLLLWMSGKHCENVSSFGELSQFKSENKPEGSPEYCLDGCPHSEECAYYAPRYYLQQIRGGNNGWPLDVVVPNPTEEKIMDALKKGQYGRCVYSCDNNVVDHQMVNIRFEDGSIASLTMCAFTKDSYRKLHIMGTKAEITANLETKEISVQPFLGKDYIIDGNTLTDDYSGHAGGDKCMMRDVIELVMTGKCENKGLTTLEHSLESHYIAFAAENSRTNNGKCINLKEFLNEKNNK